MKKLLAISLFIGSSIVAMQSHQEEEKFFPDVMTEKKEISQLMAEIHGQDLPADEVSQIAKQFEQGWFIDNADKLVCSPRLRGEMAKCTDAVLIRKMGRNAYNFYAANPDHPMALMMKRYAQVVGHKLNYIRPNLKLPITDEQLKCAEGYVPSSPSEMFFIKNGRKGKEHELVHTVDSRAFLNDLLNEIKQRITSN